MKLFICILSFTAIFCSAKSQAQDSLRIYYNKGGTKTSRILAKYYRDYIKLENGRNFYVGHGHYMDMSPESEGYYLLRGQTLYHTGEYTGYYSNGELEHQGEWFWTGRLRGSESIQVGKWKFYYENGKLKEESSYKLNPDSASTEIILLSYWDTTGRHTVINGEGYYYYYQTVPTADSDRLVFFSGKIVNGKNDSLWVSYYNNGEKYAIDEYKKGVFLKGTSYDLEGNSYSYDSLKTNATFPGGPDSMGSLISRHLIYPKYESENRIEGAVWLHFTVNKEGSVSDAIVARGVAESMDKEAVRVINTLPHFISGKLRGQPVDVHFTTVVNFRLKYD